MTDEFDESRPPISEPLTAAVLRDLISTSSRLARERDQLQRLVEHVPAVLYIDEVTDPGAHRYPTVYVGPQVETVLGITAAEWIGNDELWQQHMHPDDWAQTSADFDAYLARGRGDLVQEYRIVRPDDGRTIWVRDQCAIAREPETGRDVVLGVMSDITAQKTLEDQLRAAEAKNRALIEQIPNIVWTQPLNENSEPPYVSSLVREVFGVTPAKWLTTDWWSNHLHAEDRQRVLDFRTELMARDGPARIEYRMITSRRVEVWIGQVSQVVMNGDQPWMVQSLLEDITSRKLAEEQLEFRATHDALTRLANRSLFEETLELALARASRHNQGVALLFCDLNGFKAVNDTYGHDAGDEILREIAARMLICVRESDVVARRGGDEFLVLLPDIDPSPRESATGIHRAERVADAISRRITRSLKVPIEVQAGPVIMSMSIGRCVYPWDAADAREMLAAADAAMYRAKGTP
ncbi:MAG: diguanylate cyclase domain-containing protein [Acidimicrobiales bacterium]